ncbi:MAG: insulinase family protein [Bacilli bacterium]|nr:insulinase family protein [Bacilli bacterium]
MKYFNFDMNAYQLHVIKTDKFKTITVDISFRRKIKKEEITIRNLLKEMMVNASYNYPDEKSLIIETEKLYDLKLVSSSYRVGNDSILSFRCRFLNELYTEECMNDSSIKFLLDLVFNPLFDKELDKCKERLKKSILSLKDNKVKYALFKLLEATEDRAYSYNDYGYVEDLDNITNDSLYNYYKDVISNDLVDVFVVGDISPDDIKNIFRENFKVTTYHKSNFEIVVPELSSVSKIYSYNEKDRVNQTQLAILCNINDLTDEERKYILPVYGEMLGGTSNSILFDSVREKNSYAYYVNSIVKPYDNVMMIYSGIGKGTENEVFKLINKSLKDIRHGKFDLNKLENAKKTISSSIMASIDNPVGIINNSYAKVLVNAKDYNERIELISKVSRDDIIRVSKKINIYSKFILEANDEKNND